MVAQTSKAEKGTALVVGAGPAGIVSAVLLARDGWNVKIFEKRSDPASDAEACGHRSIIISLLPRGIHALEKAGIKLPQTGGDSPWLGGLAIAHGLTTHLPKPKAPLLRKFKGIIIAERSALVQHLTAEALRLYSNRITITYKHSLQHIDFAERIARFRPEAAVERPVEVAYDLLIGADGRQSATRTFLGREMPSMHYNIASSGRSWKSFTNLPQAEGLSMGDKSGVTWHIFAAVPTRIVAWPTANQTIAGYLVQSTSWFTEERNTAKEYERVLRQEAPSFPEEWVEIVAKQLVDSPKSEVGTAWCSNVCGPRTVLLGDSANAVTPLLGQGMNSALESAAVFAEILRVKEDVDAACQAFESARLPDLHALTKLDKEWAWRNGSKGKLQFRFLSTSMINFALWGSLHKYFPSLFSRPEGLALGFTSISYSKVLHAVHRDDAIFAAILAGIPALAAFVVYQFKQTG